MSGKYGTGRNEHYNALGGFEQTAYEKEQSRKIFAHHQWIKKMIDYRLDEPIKKALLDRIIDSSAIDG